MSNEINTQTSEAMESSTSLESDVETLVVVSKIKKTIKAKSGFNTSQDCVEALSRKVIEEINKGIESAKNAGRKTVMARDIL